MRTSGVFMKVSVNIYVLAPTHGVAEIIVSSVLRFQVHNENRMKVNFIADCQSETKPKGWQNIVRDNGGNGGIIY